jgi:phosphoribosylaminoimidazolecarboxamide formyltransferase/IMP cyclohydrolase
MARIHRAIVSVSDKTGVAEFCAALSRLGVELYASGGTAKLLRQKKVPVRLIEEYTGFPEMLDGRVKTLNPKIHGGLLALRGNPAHMKTIGEHGIVPFDMLIGNLYPFEATIARPGCTREEAIENIDIGGPSMLRSAAKNSQSVAVVCDPADYPLVLAQLKKSAGNLDEETMRELGRKAFALTARYDAAISNYLGAGQGEAESFPVTLTPTPRCPTSRRWEARSSSRGRSSPTTTSSTSTRRFSSPLNSRSPPRSSSSTRIPPASESPNAVSWTPSRRRASAIPSPRTAA